MTFELAENDIEIGALQNLQHTHKHTRTHTHTLPGANPMMISRVSYKSTQN